VVKGGVDCLLCESVNAAHQAFISFLIYNLDTRRGLVNRVFAALLVPLLGAVFSLTSVVIYSWLQMFVVGVEPLLGDPIIYYAISGDVGLIYITIHLVYEARRRLMGLTQMYLDAVERFYIKLSEEEAAIRKIVR